MKAWKRNRDTLGVIPVNYQFLKERGAHKSHHWVPVPGAKQMLNKWMGKKSFTQICILQLRTLRHKTLSDFLWLCTQQWQTRHLILQIYIMFTFHHGKTIMSKVRWTNWVRGRREEAVWVKILLGRISKEGNLKGKRVHLLPKSPSWLRCPLMQEWAPEGPDGTYDKLLSWLLLAS